MLLHKKESNCHTWRGCCNKTHWAETAPMTAATAAAAVKILYTRNESCSDASKSNLATEGMAQTGAAYMESQYRPHIEQPVIFFWIKLHEIVNKS
jgi:hypothetical protein